MTAPQTRPLGSLAAVWASVALGIAAALLGLASGQPLLVLVLASPIALAAVLRANVELARPAQVLVLIGAAFVAFLITNLVPSSAPDEANGLRPGWSQLAQASLLLAGLRLHMANPVGGLPASMGLGLLVFLGCGTVRVDGYPALLVAYAAFAFLAVRVDDVAQGGRRARRTPAMRVAAAAALVLLGTASLTSGLAVAIPRVYMLAYEWALDWVDEQQRAGFHDGPIRLGALDDLLVSDSIVMRVEGDAGSHLRGNVYSHYAKGRWLPVSAREEWELETLRPPEDPEPDDRVRAVVRYASDESDRFFVPELDAELRLRPERARVDRAGVVRTPGRGIGAEQIVVMRTPGRPFALGPPGFADLEVPSGLESLADRLIVQWAREATSPRERIDAIRARLEADYAYSLGPFEAGGERSDRDLPGRATLRSLRVLRLGDDRARALGGCPRPHGDGLSRVGAQSVRWLLRGPGAARPCLGGGLLRGHGMGDGRPQSRAWKRSGRGGADSESLGADRLGLGDR